MKFKSKQRLAPKYSNNLRHSANLPTKILIVEDDRRLAKLLKELLIQNGYSVVVEHRGDTVFDRVNKEDPDLIILDLGLPGKDGIEVCKNLRESYVGRILMMTARSTEIDKVMGLEIGADAYLSKPVAPPLLLAHIRALIRRSNSMNNDNFMKTGELVLNSRRRTVSVAHTQVNLSTAEFELIWALAQRLGKVVSREDLYLELRGFEYDGIDRSVDLRVSRVRSKLEEANSGSGDLIQTVHGFGYQLADLK